MTLFWKDLKEKVKTCVGSKVEEEDSDSEAEDPEKVSSLKSSH
jgi:hypothetical protein